jgi:SAM-dependent methyltransferase
VHGVELNPYASQIARDKYGLDVFTGTVENAGFADDEFDVVTLWDVLEHMHDPLGTLKEIQRILKPGGFLVFRVPNGDSVERKIFGPYWSGYDSPRHLYVFTRSTINKMLLKSGFNIVRIFSKHGSYLGFTLSLRFYMSGKGWQPKKVKYITEALQSSLARLIFLPLFFFYGLAQQSLQLWVVATVSKSP